MKATQAFFAVGLCVLGISFAEAQAAKCSATVTKVAVTPSKDHEKTWNVVFDVSVSGCEKCGGAFEYLAEIEGPGRAELQTVSETFNAEKSGTTRFTTTFHAPPSRELKGVKGISVKSCNCIQ